MGVAFHDPLAVALDGIVFVAVAQCGGGILCADVDGLAVDDGAQVAEDRVGERVRSVLMSSRLPQRRPGDAPCSALVLSGARRRATWFDNPSL